MRFPQLLVFEADGRLTASLGPLAEELSLSPRHVQQPEACRRALRRGGPNVLLLRAGRDLDREFALLDQVSRSLPETRIVVVLDQDDARLRGLAWDLGAAYVLPLARSRDLLADVIRGMVGQAGG
jgi:DNA-binding NarL/FixJ family response regulator